MNFCTTPNPFSEHTIEKILWISKPCNCCCQSIWLEEFIKMQPTPFSNNKLVCHGNGQKSCSSALICQLCFLQTPNLPYDFSNTYFQGDLIREQLWGSPKAIYLKNSRTRIQNYITPIMHNFNVFCKLLRSDKFKENFWDLGVLLTQKNSQLWCKTSVKFQITSIFSIPRQICTP